MIGMIINLIKAAIVTVIFFGVLLLSFYGAGWLSHILYDTKCDDIVDCGMYGFFVMVCQIYLIPFSFTVLWPLLALYFCCRRSFKKMFIISAIIGVLALLFVIFGYPLSGILSDIILKTNNCDTSSFSGYMNLNCYGNGLIAICGLLIIEAIISLIGALMYGLYKCYKNTKKEMEDEGSSLITRFI